MEKEGDGEGEGGQREGGRERERERERDEERGRERYCQIAATHPGPPPPPATFCHPQHLESGRAAVSEGIGKHRRRVGVAQVGRQEGGSRWQRSDRLFTGAWGLDWPDKEASLGDLLQALSAREI